MPRYDDSRLAGVEPIQVETIPQGLVLKFGLGRGPQ
jgi:hypothetical protein